ncbi:hypothetical protein [Pricia antarctica]|uniref:hypothetical protein n=1 Tax=Pricia antarctica TaxID=641691 RepID=UPI000B858878|nr:hypothetical protein [Pricia antarctica]
MKRADKQQWVFLIFNLVPFPNLGISNTDPDQIGSKLRGPIRFDGIAGAVADYGLPSVLPTKT